MAISSLQGQVGFLDTSLRDYSLKHRTNKNSGIAFVAIVIAHGVFIVVALTVSAKKKDNLPVQPFLQLIQLSQENVATPELEPPVVNVQLNTIHIQLPQIDPDTFPPIHADLSNYKSAIPYELPNANNAKYRDVFDPKLRQRLIDAEVFNKPRAKEKVSSWSEVDGRTFVDMGNGECLVSMRKVDSRERGTNWGMTRCGKTDSEKMMDNVNADLEARKHPLKTQ